jgi:hypothetical protein
MLVSIYRIEWHHNSDGSNLSVPRRENLYSKKKGK